jgi:hypothetical protein
VVDSTVTYIHGSAGMTKENLSHHLKFSPRGTQLRENHGFYNPRGSAGRVAPGAGVGCKILTHDQPTPAARVGPARGGLSFLPAGGRGLLRSDLRPSMDRSLAPLPPPTELQVAVASPTDSFVVQHLSSSFSQPTAGVIKLRFKHVIFNNQRSFQSTINEVCCVASRRVVLSDSWHAF